MADNAAAAAAEAAESGRLPRPDQSGEAAGGDGVCMARPMGGGGVAGATGISRGGFFPGDQVGGGGINPGDQVPCSLTRALITLGPPGARGAL